MASGSTMCGPACAGLCADGTVYSWRMPTTQRRGPGSGYRRLRLRRTDGRVYLDRWGVSADRIGGVYLHRMTAPDPGLDLHDHPWTFVTVPLWGGYLEERAATNEASELAEHAERLGIECRGMSGVVRPFRPRRMRLDECHRIIRLNRRTAWTVVFRGPRRRKWGFYTPTGFEESQAAASARRPLFEEGVG